MSTLNVNKIADSSGGVLAPISSVMRNRLINGSFTIDQRNAGASVTPTDGAYTLDRWKMLMYNSASKYTLQQNAGSVTPPAGFKNYLGITSSSAYSIASTDLYGMQQRIEGFNTSDLDWGTANAKTVTLSFWVRSSLTGTFGGAIQNNAGNRSYPFSYTINSANTWEYKTITIAGDTSGTWVGATNGIGMVLYLMIGTGSTFSGTAGAWAAGEFYSATGATSVVGTNGATFYITGVQLEKGTQATSFEYKQYGQELALCQRYYEQLGYGCMAIAESGTTYVMCLTYRVTKRAAPSLALTVSSNIRLRQYGVADRDAASPSAGNVATSTTGGSFKISGFSAIGSAGTPANICYTTTSEDGNLFSASAEL